MPEATLSTDLLGADGPFPDGKRMPGNSATMSIRKTARMMRR
jgi:hypothetical protein